MSTFKKCNPEQGKNIMLISIKEELVGSVNNVLTVVKEGGFTAYNNSIQSMLIDVYLGVNKDQNLLMNCMITWLQGYFTT